MGVWCIEKYVGSCKSDLVALLCECEMQNMIDEIGIYLIRVTLHELLYERLCKVDKHTKPVILFCLNSAAVNAE